MEDRATDQKIFCPSPWVSITAQPFAVTACCWSMAEMRSDPSETMLETFRGERFRLLREKFLAGEWPEACVSCRSAEDRGERSGRLSRLEEDWFGGPRSGEGLTTTPLDITYLELNPSDLCNLKCRMCTTKFSTKWKEDIKAVAEAEICEPWFFEESRPIENPGLDEFLPRLGSLRELMLKGGEPTLNKVVVDFVGKMVEREAGLGAKIQVVTNGTVFSERLAEFMRRFKECRVIVSIDGVDPVFRYIRHGRFTVKDIKKNLDRYAKKGIPIGITTAFQSYNMLSYDQIIDEFRPWTEHFAVTLVNTHGMSAQVAPDSLRERALETLAAKRDQIGPPAPGKISTIRDVLSSLIEFVRTGQFDPGLWSEFSRFTHGLDRIRGESISGVDPTLAAFLEPPPGQINSNAGL